MTDCNFCNRDLELGSNDNCGHDICIKEYLRRRSVGACLICGTGCVPSGRDDCPKCINNKNIRNYPGPQ